MSCLNRLRREVRLSYSADKKGRRLYHGLKHNGQYEVIALVDRRWYKLGEIDDEIQNPSIITEREFDYILIGVADEKAAQSIREYLESQNIPSEKIVRI